MHRGRRQKALAQPRTCRCLLEDLCRPARDPVLVLGMKVAGEIASPLRVQRMRDSNPTHIPDVSDTIG